VDELLSDDVYRAIAGRAAGEGWYDAAVRVLLPKFPGLGPGRLREALARCGCHPPADPGRCGYQGSLSPVDFGRLRGLLAREACARGGAADVRD
jgi:hypothetical protein